MTQLSPESQLSSEYYTQAHFHTHGFCVLPSWLNASALLDIRTVAMSELEHAKKPWELEAEVGYPFAPKNLLATGGDTPRRLLQAYSRSPVFQRFAQDVRIKRLMQQLLPAQQVMMAQTHHNCIMTKLPQFSSDTDWHQDYRYWSFSSPNLITAWLALGDENAENGGLRVIPGSHRLALNAEQFDEKKFFKTETPENKKLLSNAINITLKPGDLLCFHANLLHAATRNNTSKPKVALVFSYHDATNLATPNTRSSSRPSIKLP
ncbi:phytanoyl-CoA dioxygenase family protein [Marinagarivorans algicola]|uniref:phytanoyl-CoA dioxygenase family protein n=1 Tax=Marinagarivorans algicola TaxID=1513270 RepID=UPI0006B627AA|nr:phytanoyl-CoA dioxygenase family protein [Marinagarivorans algicola]